MKRSGIQRRLPQGAGYGRNSSLKPSPWGEKRKESYQAEAEQARMFEQLLQWHGLEWFHPYYSARSKAGWPDYVIFGDRWHAFCEIKARSPVSGRRGKLSPEQLRFKAVIENGGGEWIAFCFPDDWRDAGEWLQTKTGREIVLQ